MCNYSKTVLRGKTIILELVLIFSVIFIESHNRYYKNNSCVQCHDIFTEACSAANKTKSKAVKKHSS